MLKRGMGFVLLVLSIVLIFGCDNSITGSNIAEGIDSRAALSETESSKIIYDKIVEASDYRELWTLPGEVTNKLSAISNGSYTYNYSDNDGYSGSLKSYNYDVVNAPYHDGNYLVFKLKVYYKGTVKKEVIESKTVEASDYQTLRDWQGDSINLLTEVYDGYYSYSYSDSDGYSGSLKSYDFVVVNAPYSDGSYLVYKLKVSYRGTVYR